MDNLTYTKQLPLNYKSPRIPKQTPHNDENIIRKSAVLSNEIESPAKKLQQHSLRASTDFSKIQSTAFSSTSKSTTPKVLNSLTNQVHLQDSSKKLKSKENTSLPQLCEDDKVKRAGSFEAQKSSLEDIDHADEIRMSKGSNYDVENLRHSVVQGSKLPMINNKKVMPRNEAKKYVRRGGLDRHGNSRLNKGEFEVNSNPLNISNKVMQSNSSPTKIVSSYRPKYGFEDKEEDLNTSLGRMYLDDKRKLQSETKGLQIFGIEGNTTVIRKRYASGCARTLQSTLSGGEEEETPKESLNFSLSIAPVKGAQRTVKQVKKKAEMMLKERRKSSPEGKNRLLDSTELKGLVGNHLKKLKEDEKFPVSFSGKKEEKAVSEDEVEGEKYVDRENECDEDMEEKKVEYKEGEVGDFTKKVIEMERETPIDTDKNKVKEKVQATLKKLGVTSPVAKEGGKEGTPKGDLVTAAIARANKRLQSHIQASRMMEKEKDMIQWKREQAYKEFMLRLNFSFNVQVKVPTEKTFTSYKYYLGKGNNSMMLKSMMKQRWWWVQIDNKDAADINFLWTQLKQNKFVENLKQKRKTPFESLEGSGLFSSYCSNNETTSANSLTSIDSGTDNESDNGDHEVKSAGRPKKRSKSKKVTNKKPKKKEEHKQEDILTANLKKLFTSNEIMLMNTLADSKGNMPVNPEEYEEIGKMRKAPAPQVIGDPSVMKMCNHLESNFHLANKKALLWNMRSYYEAIKANVFDHLPLTFHVRNGFEDKEYKNFLEYYNNREKEIQEQEKLMQESKEAKKNMKKLKNIWIVKPGECTNRGIGIHVCNELSQINELVATTEGNYNGKKRTYLIQQYIEKPLLYNKRKFDIRCYILMSCINGTMKGYWYQEGYIRTATKEFSLKNVTNKLVHLTNDAVQKKAEDYGKFEAGNKLSYADFQKYLDQHYNGTINFNNDIYPKIRQLAIDSIKAVYGKIDPYRRENCFEIFGLDFMVDTDLNAWLIEVNTNPDINASSPALTRVIPPMVENALRLTIDQMYPPPVWHAKKLLLPENLLENNKFELVFDEVEDGPALRNILQPDKGATGDLILEIVAEEEEEGEEEIKD